MKEGYERTMKVLTWAIVGIVMMLLVGLLAGCTTTKYVEVEKVHNDTTYIVKHLRDSVWLHDSVYVSEKGDTVRIERWRTKYIERQVHDTCYVAKIDSIPQPYPKEVYVEKKLNWLQKSLMWAGGIGIVILVIFILLKFRVLV
jgi:hypothetical protein